MRVGLFASLAAMSALCCCSAPRIVPEPVSAPKGPPPAPPVSPLPQPPPAAQDWRDIQLTPGSWEFAAQSPGPRAQFRGAAGQPAFVIACDPASRMISLHRPDASAPGSMAVRTSSAARTLRLAPASGGEVAAASLSPFDPLLDAIAFSRGRFTVEVQGLPLLVLPAEPEPARAIEDCRG